MLSLLLVRLIGCVIGFLGDTGTNDEIILSNGDERINDMGHQYIVMGIVVLPTPYIAQVFPSLTICGLGQCKTGTTGYAISPYHIVCGVIVSIGILHELHGGAGTNEISHMLQGPQVSPLSVDSL